MGPRNITQAYSNTDRILQQYKLLYIMDKNDHKFHWSYAIHNQNMCLINAIVSILYEGKTRNNTREALVNNNQGIGTPQRMYT